MSKKMNQATNRSSSRDDIARIDSNGNGKGHGNGLRNGRGHGEAVGNYGGAGNGNGVGHGDAARVPAGVGVRLGRLACRSCGGRNLELLLSLGRTPLANSLLKPEQLLDPEPRHRLELAFCQSCALLQITEAISPETLFRHYLYFSSVSSTILASARDLVDRLVRERGLDGSSLVVEIASNDGYLLRNYGRLGVPALGIEPALNVAAAAEQAGVRTLTEFFGAALAERLVAEGRRADVIHANNVLAHVPDLNGFLHGIQRLLAPNGVAVIEVPYVRELIDRCEFDTIYHEHICYFSLHALTRLAARHALVIADVERIALHGGSLRLYIQHAHDSTAPSAAVGALLREEAINRLDRIEYYRGFAARIASVRSDLLRLLRDLKARGATIAAYGAAAKGSTLLNYCDIGRDLIDFVVDRNPHKQGLHMPGSHLPVYATERLLEKQPDYVLLLSWNFADEIMTQQADYLRRGGQFIVPVPVPRVVDGSDQIRDRRAGLTRGGRRMA